MTEENCCAECGATAMMPFETAYELYRRSLVRSVRQRATAWGLSERDVDVEALVQDTFVQALRVWDSIRVPRAWLYTVARRRLSRCIPTAALRADGDPADHTEQGTVSWTTVVPSASTEDLVAAREVIETFLMMPPQRQSVAVLRYIEGWDFNEIAELLGCCPAARGFKIRVAICRNGAWAADSIRELETRWPLVFRANGDVCAEHEGPSACPGPISTV